jgi:hypothetical protein
MLEYQFIEVSTHDAIVMVRGTCHLEWHGFVAGRGDYGRGVRILLSEVEWFGPHACIRS